MRIVFLSHLDMNLYLFRLPIMIALVKAGHEVFALTPKGEYFDEFAKHHIHAVAYHIERASLNPFKELKVIWDLTHHLKALKPDIVHTFTLKPNIYGSLAGKFAGIPKVFNSVTGLGSFYIQDTPKTKLVRCLIEGLSRLAFCFSTKVVFQNIDDLNLYVQKGIVSQEKAVLIKGSGVDVEYFSKEAVSATLKEAYIKELKLEGSVVVLMVARAIVHKGVREYAYAAKILKERYPHAVFLFVGDVDHGNIAPITRDFLESSSLQWLGKRKDIRELLACADIFVLPSYREGIPRTLLEAGSMGLPLVSTHAVGCKEVVDEGKNGFLVPVAHADALCEAIASLLDNGTLRAEFGVASRHKIVQEFSVESIVTLHLKLYEASY